MNVNIFCKNVYILSETSKVKRQTFGFPFFSVMADETRDGNTEQLSVRVRFVSCEGYIKERVFSWFMETRRFDAQCVTDTIEKVFQYYTLNDLLSVTESYDFTSVMSGAMGGGQARFRHRHPEAFYVHYYAHELNLALCHTCKAIPTASDFVGHLENENVNII